MQATAILVQRGYSKVREINMGGCPRLEFNDMTLIYYLGHDSYIFTEFDFLFNTIVNL